MILLHLPLQIKENHQYYPSSSIPLTLFPTDSATSSSPLLLRIFSLLFFEFWDKILIGGECNKIRPPFVFLLFSF